MEGVARRHDSLIFYPRALTQQTLVEQGLGEGLGDISPAWTQHWVGCRY